MVPGYDSRRARTGIEGLTKPDPKDRAAQIVAWAICWPWNVVWTFCVYNPFRYIGEFLLREIQSALFEISNGQFSEIERDLTLEPSPPPFPIRQAHRAPQPAALETASSSDERTSIPVEQPRTISEHVSLESTSTPLNEQLPETANATTVSDKSPDLEAKPATEPLQQPAPVAPSVTAIRQEEELETVSTDTVAETPKGSSPNSYSWTHPEPTAFVPISNKPLRAIKYETETFQSGKTAATNNPVRPPADPWFEKNAPNR
jgi:hypothetical protein